MTDGLSYRKAGVDIDAADAAKKGMAASLATSDKRVLNRIGAFATLYDGAFPEYDHPVLVLKTEEPGSKQKLALENGRIASLCRDLIHHLINDIVVLGARPLSVQDCIICGKLESDVVRQIVDGLASACREQDCTLTGGETTEQPGVVPPGAYLLTAGIVGVVEKSRVIDGSKIAEGDQVLAVASNGLHTNGYSLVRALMARRPEIAQMHVDGEPFLEVILRPHTCYYKALRGLFDVPELHGMAHITGGGIAANLNRILPEGLGATVDLGAVRVLPVFRFIREMGCVEEADMLRTFNMGVGMCLVAQPSAVADVQEHLAQQGCGSYVIGRIDEGSGQVVYHGRLNW